MFSAMSREQLYVLEFSQHPARVKLQTLDRMSALLFTELTPG